MGKDGEPFVLIPIINEESHDGFRQGVTTYLRLAPNAPRDVHLVVDSIEKKTVGIFQQLPADIRSGRGEIERADRVSKDVFLIMKRHVRLTVSVTVERLMLCSEQRFRHLRHIIPRIHRATMH